MTVEETNEEVVDNSQEVQEQEFKPWQIVDENEPQKTFGGLNNETVEELEQPIEQEVVVETVDAPIEEEIANKEDSEYVELDEQYAIKFLAEKKGISVEEFESSLKPKEKEALDPETEAYLKFRKETGGRSYNDFLETQKEWDKEPQENVLRHILKAKNPNLDEEEIDFLFKKKYSYDSEYDDEDVVMEKKINLKTDYREGLDLLEKQKEQYKVARGSDEFVPEEFRQAKALVDNWQIQQKESEIAMQQARADFEAKTNEVFTENFEGFKYKVGNEEFTVKPEDVNQTKSVLSDASNFDKMFFDENTRQLKDPKGYYKALYAGMYGDKLFEHAFHLGKVAQAEEDEKTSKNIQVDGVKNINSKMGEPAKRWQVEKD
jgi:hypothetical protein